MSKRKRHELGADHEWSGPWCDLSAAQQLRRAADLAARWSRLSLEERRRHVAAIKPEWSAMPPETQHDLARVGGDGFAAAWAGVVKSLSTARLAAMPQVVLPGLTRASADGEPDKMAAAALIDRRAVGAIAAAAAERHRIGVAAFAVDALHFGVHLAVEDTLHRGHYVAARRWAAMQHSAPVACAEPHRPGLALLLACAGEWCGGAGTPGLRRVAELDRSAVGGGATSVARGLWGLCTDPEDSAQPSELGFLERASVSPAREDREGGEESCEVVEVVGDGGRAAGGVAARPVSDAEEARKQAELQGGESAADRGLPCDDEHLQEYLRYQTQAAVWRSDATEDLLMDSSSQLGPRPPGQDEPTRAEQFLVALEDIAVEAKQAEVTLQNPEHTQPSLTEEPRAHPIWAYVYPAYAQLKADEEDEKAAAEQRRIQADQDAARKAAEAHRAERLRQRTTRSVLGVRRGVVVRSLQTVTASDMLYGEGLLPPRTC